METGLKWKKGIRVKGDQIVDVEEAMVSRETYNEHLVESFSEGYAMAIDEIERFIKEQTGIVETQDEYGTKSALVVATEEITNLRGAAKV